MHQVFSDQHHLGLYNSLHLLFEKRLGYRLVRPIGIEWLEKNYWRIANIYNNHPATVAQYLGIPADAVEVEKGLYKIWENGHKFWQYGITLDKFMADKPEIIIATVPEHIIPFKELAELVGGKIIYQIGNAWPIEAGLAPNIMASAKIANVQPNINFVEYHQEFDLDIFRYHVPNDSRNIYSFINCLNTASIYQDDWQLFQDMESQMTDWTFRSYGGSCRDGQANGQEEVARMIGESRFIWHTKFGGDGFGHVIYNTASVARPLIIKASYYEGKMGMELMQDGITCVSIDGLGFTGIRNKIEHYNQTENYLKLIGNIRANFSNKVKFDDEEIKLRKFLENLL